MDLAMMMRALSCSNADLGLRVLQGAKVEGPIPAPDLAPGRPMAHMAPAMAPAPAVPDNPLSFLVQVSVCQPLLQHVLACLCASL